MTAMAPPVVASHGRRLRRLPRLGLAGWCAAVFLAAMVLVALLAPLVAPHDPNATDLLAAYSPPSAAH